MGHPPDTMLFALHKEREDVPEEEAQRGEELQRRRHVAVFGVVMQHVGGVVEDRSARKYDHAHGEEGAQLVSKERPSSN
mgnify:CR=1 FL=1